jgi:hypothetical protein
LQSDKAGKHEPPSPTGRGAGSPERQRRKR